LPPILITEPGDRYYGVLQDPFGLEVLRTGTVRANPNRFFSHLALTTWFEQVPFILPLRSPIDRLYGTAALARIGIQLLLLYLLARLVSNRKRIRDHNFLLAALLILPLFQTFGFNRQMGLLDMSITYCFFYALPLGVLLLFLQPFLSSTMHGEALRFSRIKAGLWILLIPVIALSGPLLPGIVAVLLLLFFGIPLLSTKSLPGAWQKWSLRPIELLLAILLGIATLYSLYLGTFNLENPDQSVPGLGQRYLQLPEGLWKLWSNKLGLPLLSFLLLINTLIIRRQFKGPNGRHIRSIIRYAMLFALLYCLLLPLGGYRDYRADIIRYDTFLPVTIALLLSYALSAFFLLKQHFFVGKNGYRLLLALSLLVFTAADQKQDRHYRCERSALEILSRSTEPVVKLQQSCPILRWNSVERPEDSERVGRLLYFWEITDEPKRFYQERPSQ
ncbi:MAG: hypothetical protein KDC44_21500, partial [Phaeodactylibacter sp.]|nr:hypothetical protein [Phaeodactylibacter sp.]